jgi:hypothetical protein
MLARSTGADVVLQWNQLLLDAIRAENAASTAGSRTAAIVHAAMYDAINSVLRTHEPYRISVANAPGTLTEAAGVAAGGINFGATCREPTVSSTLSPPFPAQAGRHAANATT